MNCKHIIPFIPALFFICLPILSQKNNNLTDKTVFDKYKNSIGKKNLPKDSLIVETALFFLETPYVGSTLEINNEEQLVINLRELDCTTFVENCLALSRTAQSSGFDFETFRNELETIRYRDGIVNGYTSRLHYTTDWISDNIQKGTIYDKTQAIGGVKLPVNLYYISTHPEYYPALNRQPGSVEIIRDIENTINNRKNGYYYIPKNEIVQVANKIQPGDIIFFTTAIKGLDVSHAGIAYEQDGILTFIHASSKHQKVIVNQESLQDYCLQQKNNTGIIIVRMK